MPSKARHSIEELLHLVLRLQYVILSIIDFQLLFYLWGWVFAPHVMLQLNEVLCFFTQSTNQSLNRPNVRNWPIDYSDSSFDTFIG